MPESKSRPKAEEKKKAKRKAELSRKREDRRRRGVGMPGDRGWVPPLFISVGLLGVAWLVVYYVAGHLIPYMRDWGHANILIGFGLMAAAFGISTLWK